MSANSDRIIELFSQAKAKAAGEERERFVAEACEGDPELLEQVESILHADAAASGFLQNTQVALTPEVVTEKPGDRIGHYKLLEKIGEGGMGTVWMAEQTEPVRRRVALKVIKQGMDSGQVLARFEAERQALALMDHPNIAKIFDAGLTGGSESEIANRKSQIPSGRPYFVMELVKGIPLTKFCDEQRLSIRERLELFVPVCQAIQHAHQKGIIHRDIKPSNVLVALYDGKPVPKVIDFGVAKATGHQLTERTLFTGFGALVGTLEYMSPEQAELNQLDVDTRSDIYSLGVLLYELLTGTTPLTRETLREAAFDEVLRRIREEEPPRPSTRLSETKERLPSVSAQRKLDPARLRKLLRGDLDWIAMKCLEKDRRRRYETANGLSADIQRYLEDAPVVARPPSNLYRFQKLVQRNKLAFGGIAAIATVLLLGAIVSTWQAVRATRAEREKTFLFEKAQKAQAEEARQRQRTEEERQRAEELLVQMELQRAEDFFDADQVAGGLAYLARVLRRQPTNQVAAERVKFALIQRSWALPLTAPLQHSGTVRWVDFSPDGHHIVTACDDGMARIWKTTTGELLLPELRHNAAVATVRFSPDGQRVLTASHDGTARVWDVGSGQEVVPLLKHDNYLRCAEFSSDGKRVLSASGDKTARIWHAITGQALTPPLQHEQPVEWAEFSPDGQRVVSISGGIVWVWDAQTGRILTSLPRVLLTPVHFSPDGRTVAAAGADDYYADARLWDVESGNGAFKRLRHDGTVPWSQFSPDGLRLVTASDDTGVRIWDTRSGELLVGPLRHDGRVLCAQFSPDGARVISASEDNTARVYDTFTGRMLVQPLRHERPVQFARFSPDGHTVATCSADQTVILWDLRPSQSLTEPLRHTALLWSAAFSPDGSRVATASRDGSARIWNVSARKPLTAPLQHRDSVGTVDFSPDGRWLVTASIDGTARLWNAQTGEPVARPLQHPSYVMGARFSRDGKRIITWSWDWGTAAMVWDPLTGQPLAAPLRIEGYANSAEFSPDGTCVVITSSHSAAKIWSTTNGNHLLGSLDHGNSVSFAEFSPNGQRIVTASHDRTARIWDAHTGQPLTEPLVHQGVVRTARFSPDGQRVLTASEDRSARIWNARSGEPLIPPLKHRGRVLQAEFSFDGRRVVTASDDRTARVWDAYTGLPLTEPLWHNDQLTFAKFSPDARRIVTTSFDRTAKVWDFPDDSQSSPNWLAALAESVGGQRFNAQGVLEAVPLAELLKLRQEVSESSFHPQWAKWFFAARGARPIAPGALIAVAEYVQRRIEEGSLESLREAVRLSPTNGVALAILARRVLNQSPAEDPRQQWEARWCSSRAIEYSPTAPEAWLAHAEVLHSDPEATNANRLDAIYHACSRAIELAAQNKESRPGVLKDARVLRSAVLKSLNRFDEAAAENLAARGIQSRPRQAAQNLIDLSAYYNGALTESWRAGAAGNDLAALSHGIQRLGGVEFDVRGVIQLSSQRLKQRLVVFPLEVTGIPLGRKVKRLHFLHSAGSTGTEDAEIGAYVVHYSNGNQKKISHIYGRTVKSFWVEGDPTADGPIAEASVVWTGTNGATRANNTWLRLYKFTWENPVPDVEVTTLDCKSAMTRSDPFLIAITAE